MIPGGSLSYLLARSAGRLVTASAALLTAGRMPPFVSASVVVIVRDRVLTVLDPLRQEAVLPGGHLRWKETPAAGAARETLEETGYAIRPGALVGVYAGRERTGEDGIVRVIFTAEIISGSLRASSEGRPAWLPVSDYVHSPARDAAIVRDWLDGSS